MRKNFLLLLLTPANKGEKKLAAKKGNYLEKIELNKDYLKNII